MGSNVLIYQPSITFTLGLAFVLSDQMCIYVFYDLETTGLDPETERIISIGWIITDRHFVELDRHEIMISLMFLPVCKHRVLQSPLYMYNDLGPLALTTDHSD